MAAVGPRSLECHGASFVAPATHEPALEPHLGELAALSCLAPDIITSILEGKQTGHLTVATQ
jgi:hypothetical protein